MFWFYRGCFGVEAHRRHRGCFGFIGDVLGLNGAAPIPTGPTQPHSFVPPLFGAEWALKGQKPAGLWDFCSLINIQIYGRASKAPSCRVGAIKALLGSGL